jgi:hypothetical protein
VHSAGIQDRDGGILLLATLFGLFHSSRRCLPTAPIRDRFLRMRSSKSYPISKLKLSRAVRNLPDLNNPAVGGGRARHPWLKHRRRCRGPSRAAVTATHHDNHRVLVRDEVSIKYV